MNLVGRELGPFYIFDVVRRGVATHVFRAIDRRTDQEVALSVLPPDFARGRHATERFVEAGRLAMHLHHSGIWPVLDADHLINASGSYPYIAQSWVEGETVAARMKRIGGPAPVDVTAGVVYQVGEALDHLHEQGVVHGALNPTSVFLTDDGHTLLTNIALPAVAQHASLVPGSGVPDLLAFLAPEQVRGDSVPGPIIDRYSLGALAYFLLAGRPPFVATTPAALAHQTLDEPPAPIEALRPDVPFDVAYVLTRGLDKDPARRFSTAGDLAQALADAAGQTHALNGSAHSRRNGHHSGHPSSGHPTNHTDVASKSAVITAPNRASDGDAHPAPPTTALELPASPARATRRSRRRLRPAAGRRLLFNVVVTLFNLTLIALVILMLAAPGWLPFGRSRGSGNFDLFTMTPANSTLVEGRTGGNTEGSTGGSNESMIESANMPDVPEQAASE